MKVFISKLAATKISNLLTYLEKNIKISNKQDSSLQKIDLNLPNIEYDCDNCIEIGA